MDMSLRDFSQYYSGSYVRRKKDSKVFFVSNVGDGGLVSMRGVGEGGIYAYSCRHTRVLREFDVFRFDLGWSWYESVGYPVFMYSPAGRGYKKGHVPNQIKWTTPDHDKPENNIKSLVLYKDLSEGLTLEAVDRSLHTSRGSLHEVRAMVDLEFDLSQCRDMRVNGTSLNEVERQLPQPGSSVTGRTSRGSDMPGGIKDCRTRLTEEQKLGLLERLSECFTLSEAVRCASDHEAADRLCWRIDSTLAVLITPDSPHNGAQLYVGPSCIGEIMDGEVVLDEEFRSIFGPYIERKLKEK